MKRSFRLFGRLGAVLAAVAAPAPLAAQQEPAPSDIRPWRLVLEQQLKAEKTCDLVEVLMFDELREGDRIVLEGKIRCLDGRMFDFLRRNEHQKFELDLCEPAVC